MQVWETNTQCSIPNPETLDFKSARKTQRCEPKEKNIASLERLVLFNMLAH